MTVAERSRYAPATTLGVLLASAGVVVADPVLLFAAVVPLALVATGALVSVPPADAVAVERTLSETTPRPGSDVSVTLTVRNETDRQLPDIRIVDGVPDDTAVVDGSPRGHATLEPGESATVEYTIHVPRGTTTVESPTVAVRSVAGTTERRIDVEMTDEIEVPVETETAPLADQTTGLAGRIETDDAGPGVAFHSSREYRPGDPINRVDWNRYASTGQLRTVEFHEAKAATQVVVADDRAACRVTIAPGERDAGDRARRAAAELASESLAAGDRVGVAVTASGSNLVDTSDDDRSFTRMLVNNETGANAGGYLPPRGPGTAQETACRTFLDREESRRTDLPLRIDGAWTATELADYLPESSQVLFCTPLLDEQPVTAARQWLARGYSVTVVAPDPIPDTPGGAIGRIEREARLRELRSDGARVVDWESSDVLGAAVERAEVRRR